MTNHPFPSHLRPFRDRLEAHPGQREGQKADGLTCVDELDVSLQVAVDHEDLVAAGMRAGPLSHLLVMLLDVLLRKQSRIRKFIQAPNTDLTLYHSV